ncbi:MAG: TIGR01777 family oxidoreductase [Nitrospinaceae bacterium]|nr:TIGR01777 family oxidoreductase [Nitrospinaceae bacterium]
MKILVTGATGLVGRNLLPLLKDNGHEVIALTRNTDTAGVRLPIACQIVHWDPTTHTPLPDFPENINAVIHLCGEGIADGRWTRKRKQAIYDSRVLSTRNLLNLFRKSKSLPKVWISASAIGYYKNSSHPALEETSPPGNGFLANVCKDWETETFKADALGIRTVALRLGIILGPDGGITAKMLPPFRMGLGGPLGKGDSWMSWIHVRDVAGLILTALENSSYRGPINAVSPHPVKNSEFTRILAGILKRSAFFSIPAFVLKFIFGEMSQLLLVSQNVSAQKSIGLGYKFVYPKLKTALKVICDQAGHKLVTEQWVPQPVDKVFEFFSDPKNLEILTPGFLHFKIVKASHPKAQEGTIVDYRLKLHSIPLHWQSQITGWVPDKRFSDLQTRGPYTFWHHIHEFYESKGGTVIRDNVTYKLPGWVAGDILAHAYIKKDLEKIFIFRRQQIEKLFIQDPKSNLG